MACAHVVTPRAYTRAPRGPNADHRISDAENLLAAVVDGLLDVVDTCMAVDSAVSRSVLVGALLPPTAAAVAEGTDRYGADLVAALVLLTPVVSARANTHSVSSWAASASRHVGVNPLHPPRPRHALHLAQAALVQRQARALELLPSVLVQLVVTVVTDAATAAADVDVALRAQLASDLLHVVAALARNLVVCEGLLVTPILSVIDALLLLSPVVPAAAVPPTSVATLWKAVIPVCVRTRASEEPVCVWGGGARGMRLCACVRVCAVLDASDGRRDEAVCASFVEPTADCVPNALPFAALCRPLPPCPARHAEMAGERRIGGPVRRDCGAGLRGRPPDVSRRRHPPATVAKHHRNHARGPACADSRAPPPEAAWLTGKGRVLSRATTRGYRRWTRRPAWELEWLWRLHVCWCAWSSVPPALVWTCWTACRPGPVGRGVPCGLG